MINYLLFGYNNMYPLGGMEDLISDFQTKEEVYSYFKTKIKTGKDMYEYYQLVDVEYGMMYKIYNTKEIVDKIETGIFG